MIVIPAILCKKGIEAHLVCPNCKRSHTLRYFGCYNRHEVDEGKDRLITIRRVRCCACKAHTHALIPDTLVAGSVFSLKLCAQCLLLRIKKHSVKEICKKCHITVYTLYRILSHLPSLEVAASKSGQDILSFLLQLLSVNPTCAQQVFFSVFSRMCFSCPSSKDVTFIATFADRGFT